MRSREKIEPTFEEDEACHVFTNSSVDSGSGVHLRAF